MYFIPEIVLMFTIQMQFLPEPAQRNGARALHYFAERDFFYPQILGFAPLPANREGFA